jgi:hypothetical protein
MSRTERIREARKLLEKAEEIAEWEAKHGYEGADCRDPRVGEWLSLAMKPISE